MMPMAVINAVLASSETGWVFDLDIAFLQFMYAIGVATERPA